MASLQRPPTRPAAPAAAGRTERRTFPGSPSFAGLRAADGTEFAEFRRALTPRYRWIWFDIAARWALLILGYVGIAAAQARFGGVAYWLIAPVAVWIGFWFASIVLFMHEAAHFLIHPDKATNDRLANLSVCWMIGDDIAAYRTLHWQHHLHLGEMGDTEVSYHYAPTVRFGIETLLGVHAWRVFWTHRAARADNDTATPGGRPAVGGVVRGVAAHVLLLLPALWAGYWSAAAAWVLGVAVVFPYLSALRQQLEHRAEDAGEQVDYSRVPHGAVNRMFADTLMARAFGSAGFRRHLLHHWDPSISYSCFDEFEAFLQRTPLADAVESSRTTYLGTWRRLARNHA